MKEDGFVPLVAVGSILLILSVSIVGYYEWSRHRFRIRSINQNSSSSLVNSVACGKNDIERQIRESMYGALWEVGKNADDVNGKFQENWVENLAAAALSERLFSIKFHQENTPFGPRLKLRDGKINFELERGDEGYPSSKVEFPVGTSVFANLPDNSLSIDLACENLKASAVARFYLLKDRMEDFEDELSDIERRWKYAEYAMAYTQAWVGGGITLSEERSRIAFQLAVASQEIEKFGSSDYNAIIEDLTGFPEFKTLIGKYDSNVVIRPVQAANIQGILGKVKISLSQVRKSVSELQCAVRHLVKVLNFRPESSFENKLGELSALRKDAGTAESSYLKRQFWDICEDFRSIYRVPLKQTGIAIREIKESENHIIKARNTFQEAMILVEELSEDNPMLKQLQEDFTRNEGPPGIFSQIEGGTKDVLSELELLEGKITLIKKTFQKPDVFSGVFPSNFLQDFITALSEENLRYIKKVLSEARFSAENASARFLRVYENDLEVAKSVFRRSVSLAENQIREPEANWVENYKDYPGPDSKEFSSEFDRKTVGKYVIFPGKGSIGGLEKVLTGVISHLNFLKSLGQSFDEKRSKLQKFSVDEDLKNKIFEEAFLQIPSFLTREEAYEMSPPRPLKSNPGISVFHDIDIVDVEYSREDPLGLASDFSSPTPIYLWFIGTTLYWAQWKVKIELGEPWVVEIFDYLNQSIPRPLLEGSRVYVHKPLPYRQEFQKSEFSFRLVVISLRPFQISS